MSEIVGMPSLRLLHEALVAASTANEPDTFCSYANGVERRSAVRGALLFTLTVQHKKEIGRAAIDVILNPGLGVDYPTIEDWNQMLRPAHSDVLPVWTSSYDGWLLDGPWCAAAMDVIGKMISAETAAEERAKHDREVLQRERRAGFLERARAAIAKMHPEIGGSIVDPANAAAQKGERA